LDLQFETVVYRRPKPAIEGYTSATPYRKKAADTEITGDGRISEQHAEQYIATSAWGEQ